MSEYQHTQTSYTALVLMGAACLVAVIALAVTGATAIAIVTSLAGFAALSALVFGFSRLTVRVAHESVTASFSWGWPRRRIAFADITAVRAVRNPWYYGWGLRKVPRGWMDNVWGLDAVEVVRSNGKVFRIGTDRPDDLMAALSLAAL